MSLAARSAILLYEPLDPINMGSVVRVCRNCAIPDLRLLRPRVWEPERMAVSAPHAMDWIAAHVRHFEHEVDWMADLNLLVAVTGKSRGERNRRSEWPQVLDDVFGFADARVGFVFGREDHGLPNHMADRCDRLLTLPSDPDFSSFNLAQAVLLVAHAVYLREAPPTSEAPQPYPPAPHDQMERFMESVDQALVAMDFFKGNQRENILRTVRRVVRNASVDTQELATLWGMAAAVIRLAEQGTQRPPTPHQQRQQRAAQPRTPPASD